MESEVSTNPIEIPPETLNIELLDQLIEEFVLREGTDYGLSEYSISQKIEQVRKQIMAKKVKIYFEMDSESCTLVRV